jgi:hypothetical protein
MIDFISTHDDAHPQTVASARLLTAVIAQAIDDASNRQSTDSEAREAIAWLFDKDTTFPAYAGLIGADAQAIREALLAPHRPTDVSPKQSKFDESKRRRLRQHHVAWKQRKELEEKVLNEMPTVQSPK